MQTPVWRSSRVATSAWVGLALLAGLARVAQAQQTFPYTNDFSSVGFTNVSVTNASAEFSLDTDNGVFNHFEHSPSIAGAVVSTASESITGIGASDFMVSSRFTLNNVTGTGNQMTFGFGALGSSNNFLSSTGESYYLADWGMTSFATNGNWANLRIIALGDNSGFSAVGGDADGDNINGSSIVIGDTYELRLTGTHSGGTLNMRLAVFDEIGIQIGTAATATDTSPLTGQYFGYRNRTAGTNHLIDVSYDNFSIAEPPEAFAADFDVDGDVDGNDFLIWQRGVGIDNGSAGPGDGDATGDGNVNNLDLDIWHSEFGVTAATVVATSIPEPSALALVLSSVCLASILGNMRNKRVSHA